ncbi:MAG: penicillin-binding protein 2 [Steroidobacteraceae bacterium]|nr:penicillin-binding protein 2 [Steroidobacteraceae bacterium]MBP7012756.1 penicillin-binding protein 2 [Steroidobacteraceae bacterium]
MARNSRLKDHHAEQRMFGRRVVAASFVIMVLLGALFARLFYLQVVRYDYFSELSQGNRIRIEPIPPPRGLLLDREGEPLALNRPAYQLELTREQTPDVDDTLGRLVALGLLPADDVARTRRAIMARRAFDAVPVRLQLSEEELARFAVHRPDFPGVEIRPRLTRLYPHGGVGVHALGYVAAISEQDQQRIDVSKYAGTTLIGKLGIERNYEELLHGETGYQQLLVNAQGRRVDRVGVKAPELQRKEPVAGDDLYLTIDHKLQQVAEAALGVQRAAVVAIDPRNGDVLAFVSTPTFDPNGFARGLTVPEYRALEENIDKPLIDRALRGVYPPGSTIKPFVALAALQYGVMSAEDTRYCRGVWQFPGSSRKYRDWKKQGHGTVDMHKAIAQSCDTYFYGVSDQIGIDRLHDFLIQFGLNEKTGIDVLGERSGLVPSQAWKKKAFKKKELQVWFPGETVIAGIGQGYMLVTPLQLAHATATLAMRGKGFQPRLVRAVRDSRTGAVATLPPRPLPDVKVDDPRYWDTIVGGMIGVVSPGGTAVRVQAGAPYKIAGKTGTAQVFSIGQNEKYNESQVSERLRDHALFIAFAPVDDPKIAIAVLVENGRHGGSTAGPIARAVFDAYLLPREAVQASSPAIPPAAPPAGGIDE